MPHNNICYTTHLPRYPTWGLSLLQLEIRLAPGVATGVSGAIERREGLGFETPPGVEMDPPPMWGTVLNLVQYPTTLILNVWPNFASIKSYMAANIGPQQGMGVAKTYVPKGREHLCLLL